jgi:ribosome maturation factor RimP
MAKTSPKHQALSSEQQHAIAQAVTQCVMNLMGENETYAVLGTQVTQEHHKWHIEIGLDKPNNGFLDAVVPSEIPSFDKITLTECEIVSRGIADDIDALPELSDLTYRLDVSSPGINRALTTSREFAFYQHWPVAYISKVNNAEHRLEGTLAAMTDATSTTAILIDKDGEKTTLDISALTIHGLPRLELNPPIFMPNDDNSEEKGAKDKPNAEPEESLDTE